MTTIEPPRFGARLLKRLVPAQDHDALLGDLAEEFQRRRSITWYCLQILAAVTVGSLKDVRAHPLVAARAIITGLLSQVLLVVVTVQLRNVLTGAGFMWGDRWIGLPGYWHWPHAPGLNTSLLVIRVAGVVMIGWLLVRLHRGHGVTMVLACCAALGAFRLASLLQVGLVTAWSESFRTFLYSGRDLASPRVAFDDPRRLHRHSPIGGRMRLLKRLLPSQDIDALLGDIAEESRHRSRFWLWMQIAAAVVVGSTREMRKHPLLALRAIATGCVTLTIYFGAVLAMSQVVWVLSNGGYYVGGYWLTLPPHPLPRAPYDVLTALAVNAFGFVLSGWAIVRMHRAHGVAMAMPFLTTVTSLALIPLAIVMTDTGSGARTMPLQEMILVFGTLFLSIPIGVLPVDYSAFDGSLCNLPDLEDPRSKKSF